MILSTPETRIDPVARPPFCLKQKLPIVDEGQPSWYVDFVSNIR
jgi:hypothetical protein